MGLLDGKTALIVGIASKKSIAYGIAKSFHEQGAKLAFTYQNEKLKGRVEDFAKEFDSELVFPCDVAKDEEIASLRDSLTASWATLDILVHSVGFAPGHELEGDMIDVSTREGFSIAHDISSYSFIALTQAFKNHFSDKASILTLTYHGSTQTLPNYNVMGLAKASLEAGVRYLASNLGPKGIRVNAISAGPIRTLAASGIKSFRKMLKDNEQRAPLRRNVTIEEVGNSAMFLASDLSSGITGEILYVDAGFNTCAISTANMDSDE
ncbi:MAG: enoyl-ACP reductase [Gammaproteobacteria bacterium]|nr:enoyl-ACP reductase [Gammaproteobacteria bacterium]